MADTGWVLAGQGRAVNRAGASSLAWSNPGNITADDGSNATVASQSLGTAYTNWLVGDTFDFSSIPAGATINGIEVRVQLSVNTALGSLINGVDIGKSDADLGAVNSPAQGVTTTPTNYDYGSASDLWGYGSISLAEVQTSTFQALLSVNDTDGGASRTFSCDAIWMRVTYTAATPIAGSTTLTFSTSGTLRVKRLMSGSTSLTFTPAGTLVGVAAGQISGTTSLSFSLSGTLRGKGRLAGTTSLTFVPTATLRGRARISGSTTLIFTLSGLAEGKTRLIGSTSLTFTLAGTMTLDNGQGVARVSASSARGSVAVKSAKGRSTAAAARSSVTVH